jgi:hypothetical protein
VRNTLLLLGLVLLPVGALAPALLTPPRVVVALLDLGLDGPHPLVSLHQVHAVARPPVTVRQVAPGLVALEAPAGDRTSLESVAAGLTLPATPPVPCPGLDSGCLGGHLRTRPLFARGSGLVDGVVEASPTPPRWWWLAGMALAFLGVALVVLGLCGRPGLAPGALAWVVALGAAAGGVLGGTGAFLSVPPAQRSVVVQPPTRPALWSSPLEPDRLDPARDLAARLSSPTFNHGLNVTARAIPDGRVALVRVEGPDAATLDAWERRVHDRVVAPGALLAKDMEDTLAKASSAADLVWLGRVREAQALLQAPGLWSGPTNTRGSRLPWAAAGGMLSGALLAWSAAAGRRERSLPSR